MGELGVAVAGLAILGMGGGKAAPFVGAALLDSTARWVDVAIEK